MLRVGCVNEPDEQIKVLRMTDNFTYVTNKQFKEQAKDGSIEAPLGLRKEFVPDVVKQVGDKDSRKFRFTISTASVDRDGDTINPKGFDLKSFKKNPVVLFGHDSSRPPVGRASDIKVEDGSVKATVEFMDNDIDTSGFSDMIFRMIRGGFLKATSVGFLPKDFDISEDPDRNSGFFPGIDFNKQELLEFSIVPVPSNPEALIDARAKGLNIGGLANYYKELLTNWDDSDHVSGDHEGILACLKAATTKTKKKDVFNLSFREQDSLLANNLALVKAGVDSVENLVSGGIYSNTETSGIWQSLALAQLPTEDNGVEDMTEAQVEKADTVEKEDFSIQLFTTLPADQAGNDHTHTYDPTDKNAEGEGQQTSTDSGHSHGVLFGAELTLEADGHVHVLSGWEGEAHNTPILPNEGHAGGEAAAIDAAITKEVLERLKGDKVDDEDDDEDDEDKPKKDDLEATGKTVWEEVTETLQKEIDACSICEGKGTVDVTAMNQKEGEDPWTTEIVCPDCKDSRDKLALAEMVPDSNKGIRIKFVADQGLGHMCKVIDEHTGREVEGVRSVEYKAEVGEMNIARIEFVMPKAELILDGSIRATVSAPEEDVPETNTEEDEFVLELDADEGGSDDVMEPDVSLDVDMLKDLLLEELPGVMKDAMDGRIKRHQGGA